MKKLKTMENYHLTRWMDDNKTVLGALTFEASLARANAELDFQVSDPQLRHRATQLGISFASRPHSKSTEAKVLEAFIVLVKALEKEAVFTGHTVESVLAELQLVFAKPATNGNGKH